MNWNIIAQISIYYIVLTVIVYLVSDLAMFPAPSPRYKDQDIPNLLKLTTQDGKQISAVYLENKQAIYTVLFSHGNAEDLETLYPYLQHYHKNGFSVFAYDYHGYGSSEGKASESNTYYDIDAAYEYLTKTLHIPADKIILHGRSIGTGPTVDLASRSPAAGVILESPMLTALRVLTIIPVFPFDKYRNNQKIINIRVPILFIHGRKDSIIPFWHAEKLYELANAPKYFYAVEDADHNDLLIVAGQAYWEEITRFSHALYQNR